MTWKRCHHFLLDTTWRSWGCQSHMWASQQGGLILSQRFKEKMSVQGKSSGPAALMWSINQALLKISWLALQAAQFPKPSLSWATHHWGKSWGQTARREAHYYLFLQYFPTYYIHQHYLHEGGLFPSEAVSGLDSNLHCYWCGLKYGATANPTKGQQTIVLKSRRELEFRWLTEARHCLPYISYRLFLQPQDFSNICSHKETWVAKMRLLHPLPTFMSLIPRLTFYRK